MSEPTDEPLPESGDAPPLKKDSSAGAAPSQPAAASPAGPRAPDPVGQGDLSDRESDPTSIQSVPPNQWRNGRPIASQGLEIKTRKPRFTTLTMVTARPRNPVVAIAFDSDGKATGMTFLRSSGHEDIDGPIRDAVLGWRASGKPLSKLKQGDTLTIKLRLVLVQ